MALKDVGSTNQHWESWKGWKLLHKKLESLVKCLNLSLRNVKGQKTLQNSKRANKNASTPPFFSIFCLFFCFPVPFEQKTKNLADKIAPNTQTNQDGIRNRFDVWLEKLIFAPFSFAPQRISEILLFSANFPASPTLRLAIGAFPQPQNSLIPLNANIWHRACPQFHCGVRRTC